MGQTTLSERLRAVESEIAAGRPEAALELCRQVVTQYPRALAVQRVLGEVYLALRKPREALGALDRALEGNPEDARACCARAIVHQIHGNAGGALDLYRRACDINPDDQTLRAAYRELATSLGQPPYQPTRRGLARLYLRGDLLPHAVREWETLLAEQPDSLEAQVGLAEALWRSGATRAAEERCRRTLANAPSCIKPLLILAVIAHDTGNAEEAERILRRARELDPDQRIAQTLLADRLVTDLPLRALILGADQPFDGAMSRPLPQQPAPAAREGGRPRVWSRPLDERRTGAPLPQPLPPGPMTAPPAAAALTGPTARVPASAPLPPDIRSIFAETEYMLWSREDTERMEAVRPSQDASVAPPMSRETGRIERGGSSSSLLPPALREQGFSLEETEARAAINWVHWLQAQGARPRQGDVASAHPDATSPSPVDSAPAQPRQTGPLQQTTPEALRQMFEVLDSDTASLRVVEADVAPRAPIADTTAFAASAAVGDPPLDADALTAAPAVATPHFSPAPVPAEERAPSAWHDEHPAGPATVAGAPERAHEEAVAADDWLAVDGDSPSSSTPTGESWGEVPPGMSAGDTGSDVEEHDVTGVSAAASDLPDIAGASAAQEASSEPLTIEALEKGFASSGFQSIDLQPGSLARLAAESEPLGASETADTSPDAEPPTPQLTPTTTTLPVHEDLIPTTYALGEPPPGTGAEPPPAADDYPARLERARTWREAGRDEDAMAEYRTILRNAPDLLANVMGDLEGVLAANPDHAAAHRLMGDALVRQGDYIRALESYNRAVALGDGQAS